MGACPHKRHQILTLAQIDQTVGIARKDPHLAGFFTPYFRAQHLLRTDASLQDQAVPRHHIKQFPLAVVPVVTLGHTGFCDVDTELAATIQLQQLRKRAPGVFTDRQRRGDRLRWQKGQVCTAQLAFQGIRFGAAQGKPLQLPLFL